MSPKGSERLQTLMINGETHRVEIKNNTILLDLLRERFGLLSVREGCGAGACGTCTVLIDGQPISSCLKLAATLPAGSEITTVEGLANGDEMHPLQQAFWDNHALQCGFCTSGFLMSAVDLLQKNPHPSEDEIRHGLSGNLCRCTGYANIIKAVKAVADGS